MYSKNLMSAMQVYKIDQQTNAKQQINATTQTQEERETKQPTTATIHKRRKKRYLILDHILSYTCENIAIKPPYSTQ